jgi:dienelactone hydrolase
MFGPIERRPFRDYSKEMPVSDETFKSWLSDLYSYDRTELNAVVESVDDGSRHWRKEKITFDAAYGNERMTAYLFLPKRVKPPYQTVVFFPGANVLRERAFENLPASAYTECVVMSGRALMYPVYKGTYERQFPGGPPRPANGLIAHRDWFIQLSKDLRRSIDYLETRDDIDDQNIAYYGVSWGALVGPIMLTTEDRIKLGIFVVGGFSSDERPPAADPINFAPHVKVPVLMINGREDIIFPVKASQIPMFEFLGTDDEDKKHILYPGGHGLLGLFSRQIKGDVLGWLDRYLGLVD